ncbi:MAG TPA: YncE family protein [Longimicrobiales bacterium]|nr:YncE family protein [Longimicrobiales bacterium]
MRAALAAVALATGASACGSSPAVVPTDARPPADREVVWVTEQDGASVVAVDARSLEVIRRIDLRALGFSANARPHDVAAEPDGSHIYVSLIGENRVVKLTPDGRLVASAEFEAPGLLALDRRDGMLYVGRSMAAVNPPTRVGVIDRSDMSIDEIDVFFPRPHALAFDARTGTAYSSSMGENRLAAIGEGGAEIIDLAGATHAVVQVVVSPTQPLLVATGHLSGDVMFFRLDDPMRPTPAGTLHVGGEPWHPSFSPDGRTLWVPSRRDGVVRAIDVGTQRVVAEVRDPALALPHGSAVSADGRRVFVSANNTDGAWSPPGAGEKPGALVVIDIATGTVERTIPIGPNATGLTTGVRR